MTITAGRRGGLMPIGIPDADQPGTAAGKLGDDAFADLFERHIGAVWNYAYRLTGSWATAEDLAANTFLIAWRKRRTVDFEQQHPLPWLYTVTANLARTEGRRHGRFQRALTRLPRPQAHPDHADAVASDLDADWHSRQIAAAIRSLPVGEREAVELCLLGELSTAEAATALGIAEGERPLAAVSRPRPAPRHPEGD